MYSFLFDRKSLVLLLAGLVTAGSLLFVSGLLVGVFYGLPFAPFVGGSGSDAAAAVPSSVRPARVASRPCPPLVAPASEPILPAGVEAEEDGEPVPLFAEESQAWLGTARVERSGTTPTRTEDGLRGSVRGRVEEEQADASWTSSLPYATRRPAETAPPNLRDERERALQAYADRALPLAIPESSIRSQAEASKAPVIDQSDQSDPIGQVDHGELAGQPAPMASLLAAAPLPARASGRFFLQVGAYRQSRNSAKAVEELLSQGYDAYVVSEGKGGSLLSVRVGRYTDRAAAQRAALEFRQREGRTAIVRGIGL